MQILNKKNGTTGTLTFPTGILQQVFAHYYELTVKRETYTRENINTDQSDCPSILLLFNTVVFQSAPASSTRLHTQTYTNKEDKAQTALN